MKSKMKHLVHNTTIGNIDMGNTKLGEGLFDSGANCCITNCKRDFGDTLEPVGGNQVIDGIGKGLKIAGKGKVKWTFITDDGVNVTKLILGIFSFVVDAIFMFQHYVLYRKPKK